MNGPEQVAGFTNAGSTSIDDKFLLQATSSSCTDKDKVEYYTV